MSRFGSLRVPRKGPTTYIQLYPSTLEGASRMEKVARSLHPLLPVERTELVGVHVPGLDTEVEIAAGVVLRRVKGSHRPGNVGRALRHMMWQPRVYLQYRRRDLLAVAAHNVWVLPLAATLSRRTRAALIYNPHELETETDSMKGLKKRLAQRIEARYIRRCSLVSVVNELIADWYAATYEIPTPISLRNVPEVRRVTTRVREELGIPKDVMLFGHSGHLSDGRNIPEILDAFASSRHHVLFLGDGPHGSAVRAASAQHPTIHWHPPVDADTVVSHLEETDAGLCLIDLGASLSDQCATPNKLMEALAADRPTLSTDFAEARRWMGPHASDWIISEIADLPTRLEELTHDQAARFRGSHPRIPSWDEQVAALGDAYARLLRKPRDKRS